MMNDKGGLEISSLAYYGNTLKENLGLQLMSNDAAKCENKSLIANGDTNFFRHQPHLPPQMGLMPDGWFLHGRENPEYHNSMFSEINASYQHQHPHPMLAAEHLALHSHHMLQSMGPPPKEDMIPTVINEHSTGSMSASSLMKRSRVWSNKSPKAKKSKAVNTDGSASTLGKNRVKKNTELVINGMDIDLNVFPTPVCSCTGALQQCYRWGVGGWQSACCTTTISLYPLPMSAKRKGSRIAGRKMSQGAFKKVLERLAGEGDTFSNPIDLRPFWAKHGTNKFVTIR